MDMEIRDQSEYIVDTKMPDDDTKEYKKLEEYEIQTSHYLRLSSLAYLKAIHLEQSELITKAYPTEIYWTLIGADPKAAIAAAKTFLEEAGYKVTR
jgi:hypothetical protein